MAFRRREQASHPHPKSGGAFVCRLAEWREAGGIREDSKHAYSSPGSRIVRTVKLLFVGNLACSTTHLRRRISTSHGAILLVWSHVPPSFASLKRIGLTATRQLMLVVSNPLHTHFQSLSLSSPASRSPPSRVFAFVGYRHCIGMVRCDLM